MTTEFEKKAHYQNLKASCMQTAAGLVAWPDPDIDDLPEIERNVVACAKRLYNEITGQDWSGPDVEGA